MAAKTRSAESIRFDVDVRPGMDNDSRNSNNPSGKLPGVPPGDGGLVKSVDPANSSIRNVRVGDLGSGFGHSSLGAMELGGRMVTPTKVQPMVKFDSRPIAGPGPIEQQRLEQQQKNAIAMGDPDYSPMRELDYEAIKDANITANPQKSAQRKDKDFTG